MSAIHRAFNKLVLAAEGPIFTLVGNNSFGFACFIKNTGDTNSLTYRWQEADDNVDASYTDITGETGDIDPGDVALFKICSTKPNVRFMAYSAGGTQILASVLQFHLNTSDIQPILNV